MSSLATQLQGIAQTHRSLTDNIERKSRVPFGTKSLVPSILFTALEAADQSQAFLYELGLDALQGLAKDNEWWQAVCNQKDSFLLFKEDLNRSLLTLEDNKRLDKEISVLLTSLVPFVLTTNGCKMIEYLIRKGRVHELNMDALLVALLPFHETYFFKRVLILCRTGVDERWAFLDKARSLICQEFTELHKRHAPMHDYENGIQISREVLLKRFMESDTSILGLLEDFIRDYFKNEILLENISLTIHMSFWTSCLMELCHLHKAKKMTNKYRRKPALLYEDWGKTLTYWLQGSIIRNLNFIFEANATIVEPSSALLAALTEWKMAQYTMMLVFLKTIGDKYRNSLQDMKESLKQSVTSLLAPYGCRYIDAISEEIAELYSNAVKMAHKFKEQEQSSDEPKNLLPDEVPEDSSDVEMAETLDTAAPDEELNYLESLPLSSSAFIPILEYYSSNLMALAPALPVVSKKKKSSVAQEKYKLPPPVASLKRTLDYLTSIKITNLSGFVSLLPSLFNLLETYRISNDFSILDKELVILSLLSLIFDICRTVNMQDLEIDNAHVILRVELIIGILNLNEDFTMRTPLLALECLTEVLPIYLTSSCQTSSLALERQAAIIEMLMPVFVFMSQSVQSHDTQYSFHILERSVVKIIPFLLAISNEGSGDFSGAVIVWKLFALAYDSIPLHRRAFLFQTLVKASLSSQSLHDSSVAILSKFIYSWSSSWVPTNPSREKLQELKLFISDQVILSLMKENFLKSMLIMDAFFLIVEDFTRLLTSIQSGEGPISFSTLNPHDFGYCYHEAESKWSLTASDVVLRSSLEFTLDIFKFVTKGLPRLKEQTRKTLLVAKIPRLLSLGILLKEISLLEQKATLSKRNSRKAHGKLDWQKTCSVLESLVSALGSVASH